jgi:putative oxidoreductase
MKSEQMKELAPLLLRVAVGTIFIHAGWGKLTGIEGTQGFFGNIGIPAPVLMAWFVALAEFLGGVMILLGLRIRIPAILMAAIMLVAILTTKLGQEEIFRAARLDLILMFAALSLALTGPGAAALDRVLGGHAGSTDA